LTAGYSGSTIFIVELAIIFAIPALFIVAALTPRMNTRPWQGGFTLFTDTREAIKVIYRIWATWGVEHLNHNRNVLIQHFQVSQGGEPQYQTRKMP
jgi:hypothetical protein